MKNKITQILLALFILIMICIALRYCNSKPPKEIIFNKVDLKVNDSLRQRIDTVVKIKIVYKTKYKSFYDTLIVKAPDTCSTYLALLNYKCMQLDSINESVINTYGEVIESDLKVFSQYKKVIKSKDAIIDSISHSRKKFWLGFKYGFVSGAIVTEAINIIKLK